MAVKFFFKKKVVALNLFFKKMCFKQISRQKVLWKINNIYILGFLELNKWSWKPNKNPS